MRLPIGVVLASLLALSSCLPSEPLGSKADAGQTTLFIRADLSSTLAATVVVEVTAADIAAPLAFNIPTVGGVAAGTITVRAGSNRTITLRAYDAGGVETHTGSVTLNIQPGTNPTVSILLAPLAGQVPITVTLGSFSVTVQPVADTLMPGDTATMTAVILDASGQPVADQVAWATLNSAVATVVSTGQRTGRLTAVRPGRATVVAVYSGIAGPAALAVGNPRWPGEPAGWTVLNDYDMHALNDGGWTSAYPLDAGATVVSDTTAPLSPPSVWQFFYEQGNLALCGTAPGTEYLPLNPPTKQLYRGFWVKFSNPFSFAQDSEVHIAVSFTASAGGIVLDMSQAGHVYFVNEFTGNGGNFNIYPSRSPSWSLGGWHRVEMLFNYTGGIVKAWVDGVLTVYATGVYFPNDAGFVEIQFSPTWGGCTPPLGPAFNGWIWIDHVHVSSP